MVANGHTAKRGASHGTRKHALLGITAGWGTEASGMLSERPPCCICRHCTCGLRTSSASLGAFFFASLAPPPVSTCRRGGGRLQSGCLGGTAPELVSDVWRGDRVPQERICLAARTFVQPVTTVPMSAITNCLGRPHKLIPRSSWRPPFRFVRRREGYGATCRASPELYAAAPTHDQCRQASGVFWTHACTYGAAVVPLRHWDPAPEEARPEIGEARWQIAPNIVW